VTPDNSTPTRLVTFEHDSFGEESAFPKSEAHARLDDIPKQVQRNHIALNYRLVTSFEVRRLIDPDADGVQSFNALHFHWQPAMSVCPEREVIRKARTRLFEGEPNFRAELVLWSRHIGVVPHKKRLVEARVA
jgi:hypothetical protein